MMLTFNEFLNENFTKSSIKALPDNVSDDMLYSYVDYIAKAMGEELFEYGSVGSGQHGMVFKLKNGKVLKLTNDLNEAFTSQYLLNKNKVYKHIVNIYDVKKITGTPDKNFFAIIMDEVKPITYNYDIWLFLDMKYINSTADEFIKKEYIKGKYNKEYVRKNWKDMVELLDELRDAGIEHPDIHSDNVGISEDGDFILFDMVGLYPRAKIHKRKQYFDKINILPFFK